MDAIITTYHGPTNTRGSRISVNTGDGKRVSVPYDPQLTDSENHIMSTTQEIDHAEANGRAWLQSIKEMVKDLEPRTETDEDDNDTGEMSDAEMERIDNARSTITESVLSVGVRDTSFRAPGDTTDPDEYEILLSTGGPALRLIGDLDRYNQPENVRLEKQDWFKPWTAMETSSEDREALMKFANEFYFGD